MLLLFCFCISITAAAQNVIITNVSKIIELKVLEPMNLNAECSITSYIDETNTESNLYWISAIKPGSIIANIYDDQVIQYNSSTNTILSQSLPFDIDGDHPNALPLGQCKSPATNDLIICYNGGDALYANNKYIYCAIFNYKNSTLSNKFIINDPNAQGLEFVAYPQILCHTNGYVVFYSRYIGDSNTIAYTLLDIDGNILSKEQIIKTKQEDIEANCFQMTPFNNSLFLLTMAYFNNNGPIGWIGFDHVNDGNKINLMSTSSFTIIDTTHKNIDNYNSISLNVSNDCCFIVMYTMYFSLNKNSLYVSVFDINGNKVIGTDVLISREADAYFPGGIELSNLNKLSSNSKYFLIYLPSDTFLYGYVYQLTCTESNQYQLNMVNNMILQQSMDNDYGQVCVSDLKGQLFVATFNSNPFNGQDPKMYAQIYNVSLQ